MDQLWMSAPALALRLWPIGAHDPAWQLNPAAAGWARRELIDRTEWAALAGSLRESLAASPALLSGQLTVGVASLALSWQAVALTDGWLVWLHDEQDSAARLRHTEAMATRWVRALDLASVTAWRLNLVTGRAHFSDRDYRALVSDEPPEDYSVEDVRQQVHPDDRAAVLRAAEEAMSSGQVVDVEARYRGKGGAYRPLLIRRVAERDEGGRVIALSGVSLDLSERMAERQRAEAFARRTEQVTKAAGVGIWSIELDTGVIEWNEPMYRIYGLPASDGPPAGEKWMELVHPEDREKARRNTEILLKGTTGLQADFRILRPDGTVRWASSWSRREVLGDCTMLFGIVVDVTDLQEAQAELRRTQERARLAAESAGVGMWERDLFNNSSSWDAQMFRLRGVSPEGGRSPDELRHSTCHPEDDALAERRMELAARDGSVFEHEFRVIWPDGSVRWLATRGLVKRDAVSGHKRMLGVNWDITEHKRAEQALREKVAAEQASAAKSEFLARMSHELRTPLNAVLGFSQLLADDADEPPTRTQQLRIERVRSAGLHLLALIDDVLDLATIESDLLPLEREPVSLNSVLDDVLVWTQLQAAQAGVRVEGDPLTGWVLGDPRRVRQILSNLLSNGIKYNRPEGQVRISEETCTLHDRPAWCLVVRDTGQGLNPEQVRSLYQPFNRLGAERSNIQGTGIGLAIVHNLVRRMGGEIRVRSEPGVGSEFRIVLAATEPTEPLNVPTVSGYQSDLEGMFPESRMPVLYIEDNPVNVVLVQELLAPRGDVQVSVAIDGLTGVAMAKSLGPAVVLIDMQLPDIDGFEVLRRLRAEPALAGSTMVALSANAMADDVKRARSAGFDDYWTKPIDVTAFTRAFNKLVLAHAQRLRDGRAGN
jgi:PAS domain S-box-containing protein